VITARRDLHAWRGVSAHANAYSTSTSASIQVGLGTFLHFNFGSVTFKQLSFLPAKSFAHGRIAVMMSKESRYHPAEPRAF
jgi:hypothetical protein